MMHATEKCALFEPVRVSERNREVVAFVRRGVGTSNEDRSKHYYSSNAIRQKKVIYIYTSK